MHNSEIIQFHMSVQESFNKITLIEVDAATGTNNSTKLQIENTNYVVLVLAPICFMVVWFSVVFIVSISCKFIATQNKNKTVTSNVLQHVPCEKCLYFNNNYLLKCAVHPSIALTKEALNCSDYCPKN
ncbi:hypothetical protein F7734_41105 [Scytonema sp. UIC 10036]|uniref:hypothetical protein n=1 Tax=Scytonema sp. UIC 10036 TaxID=2304196 RepID=UPI0012DAF232|nr:hypothetical protein [Scytonema sp. UIC 10036]MUG98366.1 hypothetical protein [Scytonema sp. UIC 10036]